MHRDCGVVQARLTGSRSYFPRRRGVGSGVTSKKSQSGQALLEYALLISVAAMMAIGFSTFFNGVMQRGLVNFNAVLEQDLRAGGFTEAQDMRFWEN